MSARTGRLLALGFGVCLDQGVAAAEAQALTDLEAAREHHRQHPGRPVTAATGSTPDRPASGLGSAGASQSDSGFLLFDVSSTSASAGTPEFADPSRATPFRPEPPRPADSDERPIWEVQGAVPAAASASATTAPPATEPTAPAGPVPAPPRLIAGLDFARSWWHPASGTEGSAAVGIGQPVAVDYRIEPVDTVGGTVMGVMGSWAVNAAYSGSSGRELAQAASLGLGWLLPDSLWLSEVEWGRVEGLATTATTSGIPVEETIDTTWRRAAIAWHQHYLSLGLEIERLALPSAYSLDDQDGQVVAVFDPTTAWTTGMLFAAVGNRVELLLRQEEGLHLLWRGRVGIGFGELTYDHATAARIADQASYQLDATSAVVRLSGALDLGAAWQVPMGPASLQLSAGGRLRGDWYDNLEQSPDQRDGDHLYLVSTLRLTSAGLFAGAMLSW